MQQAISPLSSLPHVNNIIPGPGASSQSCRRVACTVASCQQPFRDLIQLAVAILPEGRSYGVLGLAESITYLSWRLSCNMREARAQPPFRWSVHSVQRAQQKQASEHQPHCSCRPGLGFTTTVQPAGSHGQLHNRPPAGSHGQPHKHRQHDHMPCMLARPLLCMLARALL